jgi:hypothetical protein
VGGCIVCHPNGRSTISPGCSMRVRARRSTRRHVQSDAPPTSAS